MTAKEAMATALDARQRHTGLPRDLVELNEAGKPNAGNVHGMMRLRGIQAERARAPLQPGMLSADQWQAAEWYLGKRIAYLRAIDAPGQAVDAPATIAEHDPERQAEWCRKMIAEWASIVACLQEASTLHRSPIVAAFDQMLVRNVYLEHLDGGLRIGLNALHREFLDRRAQG